MSTKEQVFRPQFTIEQTKALHRILANFEVKGDDLQEAIVIERLKKNIVRFLSYNNPDTLEQVKHALKEEAFTDFDWEAEQKKINEQFSDPKFWAQPEPKSGQTKE